MVFFSDNCRIENKKLIIILWGDSGLRIRLFSTLFPNFLMTTNLALYFLRNLGFWVGHLVLSRDIPTTNNYLGKLLHGFFKIRNRLSSLTNNLIQMTNSKSFQRLNHALLSGILILLGCFSSRMQSSNFYLWSFLRFKILFVLVKNFLMRWHIFRMNILIKSHKFISLNFLVLTFIVHT